jgi:hypothetical protein
MSQTISQPADVKSTAYRLASRAVAEGRAAWRADRPIEECAAVELGEASWVWDRPAAPTDPLGDVPEDAAFEPTPEDEAWYRDLCREREERLWVERIEAGSKLAEKLFALANDLLDGPDDDLRGLGLAISVMGHEAMAVEAMTWEQYQDRKAAMMDARP